MSSRKILIVDDDLDFANSLANLSQIYGYEVEIATSGEEALKKFVEGNFEITFMDVQLPGVNGVESFIKISRVKRYAKVVIMTGCGSESLLNRAINHGAVSILYKPFGSDVFLHTLESSKSRGNVLVADWDGEFAESVESLLSENDFNVTVSRTLGDALHRMIADELDLIVFNVQHPMLDKVSICMEYTRNNRKVPSVITTGYESSKSENPTNILLPEKFEKMFYAYKPSELLKAIDLVVRKNPISDHNKTDVVEVDKGKTAIESGQSKRKTIRRETQNHIKNGFRNNQSR